jgi:HEPN domain-containing protein
VISKTNLIKLAKARLKDAEVLYSAKRYDGSVYLCGYVIELALKARIAKTLKWTGFPETRSEFQNYTSFRTHDLDVLLSLSGKESIIRARYLTAWSVFSSWSPERRYNPVGTASRQDAKRILESAKMLVGIL